MSNTAKVVLILIAITITLLIYINVEPRPDSKRGQRLETVRREQAESDSIRAIERAKADSIRKIEESKRAAELAYQNRPWKLDNFVDDFGDPDPNAKHIRFNTKGTFSNSATSNEILYVKLIITKSSVGIFLREYEITRSPEKPIGTWTILMKSASGETLTFYSSSEWSHTGGLAIRNNIYNEPNLKFLSSYDATKINNFLKRSSGTIKVVVQDAYSSTYRFDVDPTGFTREFNLL